MNPYTSHINLYDLAFLGVIFIGLNFILFLWFAKRINRAANRFLALVPGFNRPARIPARDRDYLADLHLFGEVQGRYRSNGEPGQKFKK